MLLFLKIMFTEFIAEMGDKTQLMLVAMTSKYKMKDILLGTGAAILVLNGIAVLAGGMVSEVIPTSLIRLVAAGAFLFFAASTLKGDDEEEEEMKTGKKAKIAALSVFSTFFVAELGDKTQLTAITFGANEGLQAAAVVWLACSIGLFAADIIGMLAGYLLKNKMQEGVLNSVAFVIFSVFGLVALKEGLGMLLGEGTLASWGITGAVALIFAFLCFEIFRNKNAGKK